MKSVKWKTDRLDSLCVLQRGFDLPKKSRTSGDYPLIASNGAIDTHNEYKVASPGVVTGRSGSIGNVIYVAEDFWPLNTTLYVKDFKGNSPRFVYYFLQNFDLKKLSSGTGVPTLNRNDVHSKIISYPSSRVEQNKIANTLEAIDRSLELTQQEIDISCRLKKALLLQVLNGKVEWQEGSNSYSSWSVKKIGDVLSYEQPTNYLVKSTSYQDSYETPVLTAGKTFVLGKTNEEHGIFNDLPAIIFDDFTTASKYVDFPFKAKSSAMKILKTKNEKDSLKLIYELMQLIKFSPGSHKRHWISEYQNLTIMMPPPSEQEKITKLIVALDKRIAINSELKVSQLKLKRGLMQDLLTVQVSS